MIFFGIKMGILLKSRNQGNQPIAITKKNFYNKQIDYKHQEKKKLVIKTSRHRVFIKKIAN